MPDASKQKNLQQISLSTWVLGFVSLLMNISSEMIHSLLPVFLVSVMGVSAFAVGIIEGTAETSALIVKVFSGTLRIAWAGARRWR